MPVCGTRSFNLKSIHNTDVAWKHLCPRASAKYVTMSVVGVAKEEFQIGYLGRQQTCLGSYIGWHSFDD